MKNTWTDLRKEADKCIKNGNLEITPINITKWNEIENKIIRHFTGNDEGFTWMWENKILTKFEGYAKQVSDYNILVKIITGIINANENLWFFIEDRLNYQEKYWGYEGRIGCTIKLLGELPFCDFYIVSKKLEWVIGQNHHDVLFCWGSLVKLMELKIKENNI